MKTPTGGSPAAPAGSALTRRLGPWLIVFGVVVTLRLLLPGRPSDTGLVHEAIVDSLLAGHNWGRQALVGALEYPLLPTLGLLAARTLVGPTLAVAVLVALSQAWTLCYLLRLRQGLLRRAVLAVLLAAAAWVLPDFRAAWTALDPHWIAAVPFAAAIFHLARWFGERGLRDAVLTAVNAGLLSFCGLGGLLAGLGLVLVLVHDVRRPSSGDADHRQGLTVLVWTPLLYCLVLWLLWNWLVLGDLLFCVKHLASALSSVSVGEFVGLAWRGLRHTPPVLWASALCLLAVLSSANRRVVRAMLVLCAILALTRSLCLAAGLLAGVSTLLVVTAAAAALGLVPGPAAVETVGERRRGALWRVLATLAAAVVLVLDGMAPTVADPVAEADFAHDAPGAVEITGWIDRDWTRSRTAVFGVRLPALYHDPLEQRFVARMDYHESLFMELAQDEVMHLLLPPPDGRFYPRGNTVFARLYEGQSPILLLERQWDSGWQLWRCVITPDDESRLKGLQ